MIGPAWGESQGRCTSSNPPTDLFNWLSSLESSWVTLPGWDYQFSLRLLMIYLWSSPRIHSFCSWLYKRMDYHQPNSLLRIFVCSHTWSLPGIPEPHSSRDMLWCFCGQIPSYCGETSWTGVICMLGLRSFIWNARSRVVWQGLS